MSESVNRRSRAPWISLVEVAAFLALMLIAMWGGEKWRPPLPVIAVLVVSICGLSAWYHGDSREELGFTWKNAGVSTKRLLIVVGPVIAVLAVIGAKRGFHTAWNSWFNVAGYPIWVLAQDYALLSFATNRLSNGLSSGRLLIPWITGLLFAAPHIPNPILTGVTLVAGIIFAFNFLRWRTLWPIVIAHSLVGISIPFAFYDVPGIMSVGPAYVERIAEWRELQVRSQAAHDEMSPADYPLTDLPIMNSNEKNGDHETTD
jgi:hypothetical protein